MRKDRYNKRKFHSKSLTLVLAISLAFVLVISCSVGATLAWLSDTSEEVTNVFTTSNIDIELTETDTDPALDGNQYNYKMIPGWTIDKDPVVTVKAGSEDCYVFIKVDKSENLDKYIAYNIEPEWKLVPGQTNVYYVVCPDITADRNIKILAPGSKEFDGVPYSWSNNEVLTLPTVTKEMMNDINNGKETLPTLTFTAYASQYWKNNTENFTPEQAWDNVKDLASGSN